MTEPPRITPPFELMSPYERDAWLAAVERVNSVRNSKVRQAIRLVTDPAKKRAGEVWELVPGHEELEKRALQAIGGFKALTFDPALRSVDATKVLRRYEVSTPEELREIDLKTLDRSLPSMRTRYAVAAGAEGGVSAWAVTGAQVSATVSGGVTLGVAAAAIATDVTASMTLLGRVIGRVAAEYGYDVRLPEEESYALGVMSLGAAATAAEKAAALASLRQLTSMMMRQATWSQLNSNAWVAVIKKVYGLLGERLTHRKLAQAVPVAGVLVNSGLSAQMVDAAYRSARDVYRLRFLSEKYGIDPASWTPDDPTPDPDGHDPLGEGLNELPELHGVEGEA